MSQSTPPSPSLTPTISRSRSPSPSPTPPPKSPTPRKTAPAKIPKKSNKSDEMADKESVQKLTPSEDNLFRAMFQHMNGVPDVNWAEVAITAGLKSDQVARKRYKQIIQKHNWGAVNKDESGQPSSTTVPRSSRKSTAGRGLLKKKGAPTEGKIVKKDEDDDDDQNVTKKNHLDNMDATISDIAQARTSPTKRIRKGGPSSPRKAGGKAAGSTDTDTDGAASPSKKARGRPRKNKTTKTTKNEKTTSKINQEDLDKTSNSDAENENTPSTAKDEAADHDTTMMEDGSHGSVETLTSMEQDTDMDADIENEAEDEIVDLTLASKVETSALTGGAAN